MSKSCPTCGQTFSGSPWEAGQAYVRHCMEGCHGNNQGSGSSSPVTGFVYEKDDKGHFYVGCKGDIRNNHWHLAPDGTVLSVKEGGHHLFRRTDVTRNIREVCPELDISFLWKG